MSNTSFAILKLKYSLHLNTMNLKFAIIFVTATGATLEVNFKTHGKHFDKENKRDIYFCVIKKNHRKYSFHLNTMNLKFTIIFAYDNLVRVLIPRHSVDDADGLGFPSSSSMLIQQEN